MSDILKSIAQFVDVPAATSASLPHGLNVKGRPEVPDHVEVNNGVFTVTADDTDVTVTNTSLAAASVDALCEMWHSIPRVFGLSNQNVKDSLPVRPYVPAGAGSGGGGIVTGPPVRVRGSANVAGTGTDLSLANHEHRLEMQAEDEGALVGARPTINFIGEGVNAVDNPGDDRIDVTIPGGGGDGCCVERSLYKGDNQQTSSKVFVDGMSGGVVTVPLDGDYWAIFEGEVMNQSAAAMLEIGISVNSLIAVVAGSERFSKGNASDERTAATTVQLPGLTAGDVVRMLFREASPIPGVRIVQVDRRRLTIFRVQ